MTGRSIPHALWAVPLLALIALLGLAVATQALPGWGGGAFDARGVLEAEAYDSSPASICNPTYDGEWSDAKPAASLSGGGYAFLPQTGCYMDYAGLSFPSTGQFDRMFVAVTGSLSTLSVRVQFIVDGTVHQTATISIAGGSGYQEFTIPAGTPTPAGTHSLRVTYTVLSGAGWHNLYLDCFKFEESDTLPCLVPGPTAKWSAIAACHEVPVAFTDISTPASGIAIKEVYWDFGDGTTAGPLTAPGDTTHKYAPGTYTVTITIEDAIGQTSSYTDVVSVCNDAPVLAVKDVWVLEGDSLVFTVGGIDPNGDSFTLSVDSLPAKATFDPSIARIHWATEFGDTGNYPVVVTLTDTWGASASGTMMIHVLPRDMPPGSPPDLDKDGWHDMIDNCPTIFNPGQEDSAGDGVGDVCVAKNAGGGDEADGRILHSSVVLPTQAQAAAVQEASTSSCSPGPLGPVTATRVDEGVRLRFEVTCGLTGVRIQDLMTDTVSEITVLPDGGELDLVLKQMPTSALALELVPLRPDGPDLGGARLAQVGAVATMPTSDEPAPVLVHTVKAADAPEPDPAASLAPIAVGLGAALALAGLLVVVLLRRK